MKRNAKLLLLFLVIPFLAISQNVNINVHFEDSCMKLEHGFTDLVIEIENQSDKTAWIKYSNLWPCIRNPKQSSSDTDVLPEWIYVESMSPEDDKKIKHDWIKVKGNSCEIIHVHTNRLDFLNPKVGKDYVLHSYYIKSGKRKDRNEIIKCNDLTFQMCE